MAPADQVSGIVVRVTLPPPLQRIRRLYDRAATSGVPAHVTLLSPFMPIVALTPGVRDELAGMAAGVQPFDVRFEAVGRFPNVVYLAPEPAAPFDGLTAAIVARFPDHPPYEGAFETVIPHLTLVESPTAPLDELAGQAQGHLPFSGRVSTMEMLVKSGDGRWRVHWRIPLGVRP